MTTTETPRDTRTTLDSGDKQLRAFLRRVLKGDVRATFHADYEPSSEDAGRFLNCRFHREVRGAAGEPSVSVTVKIADLVIKAYVERQNSDAPKVDLPTPRALFCEGGPVAWAMLGGHELTAYIGGMSTSSQKAGVAVSKLVAKVVPGHPGVTVSLDETLTQHGETVMSGAVSFRR